MSFTHPPRIAITAFAEPGTGRLLVWRAQTREMLGLCHSAPSFDPQGHIRDLFDRGCDRGIHRGREVLEDRARTAWSHPSPAGSLVSGSRMERRESALWSAAGALDLSLGYLDLLITVAPYADEALPPDARERPELAMEEGWAELWGASVVYCGTVEEDEWESYHDRALATLALLERSEIREATLSRRIETCGALRV